MGSPRRGASPHVADASARSRRARSAPIEVALDVTERVREREQLRDRLTQQAAVSALGSLALEGRPVAELLDEAARALYETLASDLIVVLERTADGAPSIRASAGEEFLISAVPSRELRRALALLCDTGTTLLSSHLPSETRFRAPALEAFGILSLVAAPTGSGAAAFGALVACSRRRAAFSTDDLAFVESIAHVLMAAIERERERAVVAAAAADSLRSGFWELSHDLLAVFSSDGRFLEVSSSWQRVLGWAPEELIGRAALELVVPEDRPATVASADLAMLGGDTVSEVVNRYRAKDGSSRRLLWSVHQGPDGLLHAVAKDITERYEQQALATRRTE
ncbi:MAG TPA: PAS domain S-box protein, partial [Thermoleophilaceae bacterium]|nr:PAS domain S-box protein [Thermoleophilaceae bacterium]